MKKLVPVIILLLAVFLGILVFVLRQSSGKKMMAAELVGPDVGFLVSFPDVGQTAKRWREGPAGKLFALPSVRAFLERPLREALASEELVSARSVLTEVQLAELFLAGEIGEGHEPILILGFRSAAGNPGVETALRRLHKQIETEAGTAPQELDVAGMKIRRQIWKDSALFSAVADEWGFLGNHQRSLEQVLLRLHKKEKGASLADAADFRQTLAALSAEAPDFLLFARPGETVAQLRKIAEQDGTRAIPEQFSQIEQWKSFAATVELGDKETVEKMVLLPGSTLKIPSTKTITDFAKTFAPSETLFLTAFAWEPSTQFSVIWPSLPEDLAAALGLLGINPQQLATSLGDKAALSLWWPGGSMVPSALATLELKDESAFGDIARKVGSLFMGDATVDQSGEVHTLTFRADPIGLVQPVVAWRKGMGFVALSSGDLGAGLQVEKVGTGLAQTDLWKNSAAFLNKGDVQITLLDVPGLVRRAYAAFQPLLGFAAALNPRMNQYADFSRLPDPEELSSQLTPVVSRQTALTGGGLISETRGAVTFGSLLLAPLAGLPDGFAYFSSLANQ